MPELTHLSCSAGIGVLTSPLKGGISKQWAMQWRITQKVLEKHCRVPSVEDTQAR
jgi:hypothetical protein